MVLKMKFSCKSIVLALKKIAKAASFGTRRSICGEATSPILRRPERSRLREYAQAVDRQEESRLLIAIQPQPTASRRRSPQSMTKLHRPE